MKQVLVLNSGSSTIKYQLINVDTENVLAGGNVECIGEGIARAKHVVEGVKHTDMAKVVDDHAAALEEILEFFDKFGPKLDESNLIAIGHRVVHGGVKFDKPILIDEKVENTIDELSALAPLHNPAALKGIKVAKSVFANTPHVAVFDTAYHRTLPEESYAYAIDTTLAARCGIRKYGFHGTSYEYVMNEAAKILAKPLENLNTIVMHLGSGSSITAVKNGKSFDTSMGMTPLSGLVMGTRSGDIDPAAIFHLARYPGMSLEEIDDLLNKKSGLYGLNEGVVDMREVMDGYDRGDEITKRAVNIYVQRIHHYIGAYFVELGHVDAIILTAGIGENNGRARRVVMNGLEESLGIKIDDMKNMGNDGYVIGSRMISTSDSKIPVLVIQTNEELSIARQAAEITQQFTR